MGLSVTILGSNSALPTSDRYPTAQIVNLSERFFLVDCGEGVQMQLRRNRINFSKINHIFLSHLHGDHVFGLMGLVSTFGLLGRRKSLTIHAHSDLESLLQPHLDYFCADLPYQIVFSHLNYDAPHVIYEDKKVTVESFPLSHRIPTCGFLFKEKTKEPNIRKDAISRYQLTVPEIVAIKNRQTFIGEDGHPVPECELLNPSPKPLSYAFCSDTRYFRRIIPIIKGVTMLYHEATFLHELKDLAKRTGHTTAKQAATIARDAQVGKLLLGHFSSRYRDLDGFQLEAESVFESSVLVSDNATYEL